MNNSSPKNLDCWSVRRQETKIIGRWKKRRKGGTKIVAALYLVPSRNCDSMELRFNRYVIKTCFPRFSSLVNPPPPPPPPIIALMRLSRYTLERKGNGTMIDYYSLRAIYALNIPRWGLDRFRRDLFLFDEEIKEEGGGEERRKRVSRFYSGCVSGNKFLGNGIPDRYFPGEGGEGGGRGDVHVKWKMRWKTEMDVFFFFLFLFSLSSLEFGVILRRHRTLNSVYKSGFSLPRRSYLPFGGANSIFCLTSSSNIYVRTGSIVQHFPRCASN